MDRLWDRGNFRWAGFGAVIWEASQFIGLRGRQTGIGIQVGDWTGG